MHGILNMSPDASPGSTNKSLDAGRPAKRLKLLSDEESSDSEASDTSGGVKLNKDDSIFSINKEYARRFEHNSKRAELQRLEEKYGEDGDGSMDDEDSTSASEDDDGALASGALEADFHTTLQAIKSKDPRIYKQEEKFYMSDDEDQANEKQTKTEKPMFLSDYHRQNLLNGNATIEKEEDFPSYQEQQNTLKESLVKEMHAIDQDDVESESGDEDMFKVRHRSISPVQKQVLRSEDVDKADQDPEGFLSKFLDSRAWVAKGSAGAHVFESDDEEEDRKAEEFEEAYNLRFENPNGINEKLISHARDTAAKYSVRDETKSRRQRARGGERAKKEGLKLERTQEKAQLKRLRLEEMERKLEKIKEAAGGNNTKLELEDWSEFLAEDWDDDKWEQQMTSRFNEKYYEQPDADLADGELGRKKTSKPKWEDDIDIGDIIPDFEEENAEFSLSEGEEAISNKKKSKAAVEERKKEARKNKRKLGQLAEEKVNLELMMQSADKKGNSKFRYREASPMSWGLSSRDILMASDSQLNQFAGLKKLASFREAEKRKKDKKKLGKKARLRQWRRETFGNADGPQKTIQDLMKEVQRDEASIAIPEPQPLPAGTANDTGKRKRSGKNKKIPVA